MSVPQLANILRAHAQMAQGEVSGPRVGIVTAYDPSKYAVRVKFWPRQDESTGWIPLQAQYVGNGWGMVAGPSIGDEVKVTFESGDADAGTVSGRLFTDQEQPPAVPSGEFWLIHKTGAFLKFTNDGKFAINSQVEIDATAPTVMIQATGNVNVQAGGAASITAPSIQLGAAAQSLLSFVTSAFMTLFNTHTHPEHDGGNTSPPNQQMGASHLTTTVKGG